MRNLKTFLLLLVPIIVNAEERVGRHFDDKRIGFQNVVKIDLSQCTCSMTADCDLTIIKSSLMEIDCAEGQALCCPMSKMEESEKNSSSVAKTVEDEPEPTPVALKPSPVTNIRVYTVNALYSEETRKNSSEKYKSKSKTNCRCKARSSCPHKYIDYGFGFHCNYTTVRCCIPEEMEVAVENKTSAIEAVNEMRNETKPEATVATTSFEISDAVFENNPVLPQAVKVDTETDVSASENGDSQDDLNPEVDFEESSSVSVVEDQLNPIDAPKESSEGELTIREVTSWSEEDYGKDLQCSCMPIQKCRTNEKDLENSIERRRDTLCPGDLIQCCGYNVLEEIITKKSDDAGAETEYHVPAKVQELPPYQQPIQLPESNDALNNESEESLPQNLKEEALSPPQLPDQYQNYEYPSYNNNNGYNYPQHAYPAVLSGPQNYQRGVYPANGQNIRPWVSLASPSSYNQYDHMRGQLQGYPRGHYGADTQQKPARPGGLFDTLTKFLG